MKDTTKIIGKNVILIPYEARHVKKYHEWMQDSELQKLTASEPLTLEEEYAMQKSWRDDENKCTFLILSREIYDRTGDEIESLIGDTNLFLSKSDDLSVQIAEAEIMIAEKSARGKGHGWESMLLMLKYGQQFIKVDKFEVKIGMENIKSLKMFEKMHFKEVARSDCFQEVTLEVNITEDWMKWLDAQISTAEFKDC